MSSEETLHKISYFEYKVINELMHAHVAELGKTLRAIIVFGKLKTEGGTFDIELLEVVDGWEGPPRVQSGSTADLPTRGKIYFYFMSSADFEQAVMRGPAAAYGVDADDADRLLARVLEGYEVIYQVPAGYVRELFGAALAAQEAQAGGVFLSDPRRPSLLSSVARGKVR